MHTEVRLFLRLKVHHLGWNIKSLDRQGHNGYCFICERLFFLWKSWEILRWAVVCIRVGTLLNILCHRTRATENQSPLLEPRRKALTQYQNNKVEGWQTLYATAHLIKFLYTLVFLHIHEEFILSECSQ